MELVALVDLKGRHFALWRTRSGPQAVEISADDLERLQHRTTLLSNSRAGARTHTVTTPVFAIPAVSPLPLPEEGSCSDD